jgi:SpoU rRNA methylase family enzyme
MIKAFRTTLFLVLFFGLSSMEIHKFYVSIYQVNYAPKKKMIQITSRLFIDDVNDALEKKFKKRTYFALENETPEDEVFLKKYFAEKFIIKVNGVSKALNYLSKDIDGNVVICYFSVKDLPKISSVAIENSALMELNEEQQNIIQANINGEKQSLLLTSENFKGMLK